MAEHPRPIVLELECGHQGALSVLHRLRPVARIVGPVLPSARAATAQARALASDFPGLVGALADALAAGMPLDVAGELRDAGGLTRKVVQLWVRMGRPVLRQREPGGPCYVPPACGEGTPR